MNAQAINQQSAKGDAVEGVARAVLYEGYLLYPYRPSSIKNRQRWNFGVLFPPGYCERHSGAERSMMQTECLIESGVETVLTAAIKFLQHTADAPAERDVLAGSFTLTALSERAVEIPFSFPNLSGLLEIASKSINAETSKVTVRIFNRTAFDGIDRDEALCASLISTHTLLTVGKGAFHSMIDPPAALISARDQCENIGAWPVLAGHPGERNRMLSAPIILYDYPQVAPESRGDLFDNTEIDEILTLRIRTLTDGEKKEMQMDERARKVLEEAESLSEKELLNLHGVTRMEPGTQSLRCGDRVRLHPRRRADIFDLALAGRTATVCSLEVDFEQNHYVCVVVDDDPGKDLGREAKPGHRFFFGLDEVQKL